MYRTFADQNRVFQSLGVGCATRGTITEVGEPEDVRAIGVSEGLLETFNVPPAAGRWFPTEDFMAATRPPPTVLRVYHHDAQLRVLAAFRRRSSVVGRTLTVDGLPKKVVGVMPAGFRIVNARDMIFPLAFDVSRFTLGGFNYPGHRPAAARRHDRPGQRRPGTPDPDLDAVVVGRTGHQPQSYESWNIAPAFVRSKTT